MTEIGSMLGCALGGDGRSLSWMVKVASLLPPKGDARAPAAPTITTGRRLSSGFMIFSVMNATLR